MKRYIAIVLVLLCGLVHAFAQAHRSTPWSRSPHTTVNCSISGTAIFAQAFSVPDYSAISIQSVACHGTASYTYPVAFTYTPSASGALSAIAPTISTTAVTVTGTGSSGFLTLEALQ
jgi:hypothetical protein